MVDSFLFIPPPFFFAFICKPKVPFIFIRICFVITCTIYTAYNFNLTFPNQRMAKATSPNVCYFFLICVQSVSHFFCSLPPSLSLFILSPFVLHVSKSDVREPLSLNCVDTQTLPLWWWCFLYRIVWMNKTHISGNHTQTHTYASFGPVFIPKSSFLLTQTYNLTLYYLSAFSTQS